MTINTNSYSVAFNHLYIKSITACDNKEIISSAIVFVNTKAEFFNGDPYRIRTDVNGVRGRCLNHLTNGPLVHLQGLEPGTH